MRRIVRTLLLGAICLLTSPLESRAQSEPQEATLWPDRFPQETYNEVSFTFPDEVGRAGAGVSIKAGAVSSLGTGFYEQRIEDGWLIEFNLRQSIGPCWNKQPLSFFVEYGGSYARRDGDDQPFVTSGTFVVQDGLNPDRIISDQLDSFFETSLEHVSYGGVQAAAGAVWYPDPRHPNIHFTVLSGLRWGLLGASFGEAPTAELLAAIAAAEDQLVNPQTALFSAARRDDAYFGLYGNIGVAADLRDVVHVGVQVGFDHLWIDLGDFGRSDNGLGTVSILGTVSALY